MIEENLIKSGSYFIKEVTDKEEDRTDYFFGIIGEQEHGHVVTISGSPIYNRYMSGVPVILASGDSDNRFFVKFV